MLVKQPAITLAYSSNRFWHSRKNHKRAVVRWCWNFAPFHNDSNLILHHQSQVKLPTKKCQSALLKSSSRRYPTKSCFFLHQSLTSWRLPGQCTEAGLLRYGWRTQREEKAIVFTKKHQLFFLSFLLEARPLGKSERKKIKKNKTSSLFRNDPSTSGFKLLGSTRSSQRGVRDSFAWAPSHRIYPCLADRWGWKKRRVLQGESSKRGIQSTRHSRLTTLLNVTGRLKISIQSDLSNEKVAGQIWLMVTPNKAFPSSLGGVFAWWIELNDRH